MAGSAPEKSSGASAPILAPAETLCASLPAVSLLVEPGATGGALGRPGAAAAAAGATARWGEQSLAGTSHLLSSPALEAGEGSGGACSGPDLSAVAAAKSVAAQDACLAQTIASGACGGSGDSPMEGTQLEALEVLRRAAGVFGASSSAPSAPAPGAGAGIGGGAAAADAAAAAAAARRPAPLAEEFYEDDDEEDASAALAGTSAFVAGASGALGASGAGLGTSNGSVGIAGLGAIAEGVGVPSAPSSCAATPLSDDSFLANSVSAAAAARGGGGPGGASGLDASLGYSASQSFSLFGGAGASASASALAPRTAADVDGVPTIGAQGALESSLGLTAAFDGAFGDEGLCGQSLSLTLTASQSLPAASLVAPAAPTLPTSSSSAAAAAAAAAAASVGAAQAAPSGGAAASPSGAAAEAAKSPAAASPAASPVASPAASPAAPAASSPAAASGSPTTSPVVDKDQLDAFASAVQGARGLPEGLQGDLLDLLKDMPSLGQT